MPCYLYQHPKTLEVKEIVQSIHEEHTYEENGEKWNRIFTAPNSSVDTRIDPHSSKDFVNKTAKKKDRLGDLWDRSKELSERREKDIGKDPVKEKFFEDYSKRRKGRIHPEDPRNNRVIKF